MFLGSLTRDMSTCRLYLDNPHTRLTLDRYRSLDQLTCHIFEILISLPCLSHSKLQFGNKTNVLLGITLPVILDTDTFFMDILNETIMVHYLSWMEKVYFLNLGKRNGVIWTQDLTVCTKGLRRLNDLDGTCPDLILLTSTKCLHLIQFGQFTISLHFFLLNIFYI